MSPRSLMTSTFATVCLLHTVVLSVTASSNDAEELHLCPCPDEVNAVFNISSSPYYPRQGPFRVLQEEEGTGSSSSEEPQPKLWETIYVSFVLLFMFVALISDRIGADWVMMTALTLCMAAKIITVDEGLVGFSNEGVITVLVLFVVASGISHTGALDWYMGKLLGRPKTVADAQLRLMIPIAIVSAFLNNTPVVVVMIPIVQRWSKNIGISVKQLLIPLSFASILGGTCTLIGTSTNLVVYGLLQDLYPGESIPITLFSLGEYGVPVAFVGGAYLLIFTPCFLPSGENASDGAITLEGEDNVLLGARLTKWSSAAGRTVKRSGLRDTGGLYLVSVHRAATGNVHRAVGQEFVLQVGDILYFTGLVEGFGDFCEEHGLEIVTNEVEDDLVQEGQNISRVQDGSQRTKQDELLAESGAENELSEVSIHAPSAHQSPEDNGDFPGTIITGLHLSAIVEDEIENNFAPPSALGVTKESLATSDATMRLRCINRMTDMIRGIKPSEPMANDPLSLQASTICCSAEPAQIVVASDERTDPPMVIIGVNCLDRPGLLHDISKGLLRLNLQCHHTEASVIGLRSISIWRCEILDNGVADGEEIWSVLNALLENESGIQAIKQRGLMVLRAVVLKGSRLIGKTAAEADFRQTYRAAIVAVRRDGRNTTESLSTVKFLAGDILILQASKDSYLLVRPEPDFYRKSRGTGPNEPQRKIASVNSLVQLVKKSFSQGDLQSMGKEGPPLEVEQPTPLAGVDVDEPKGTGYELSYAEDDNSSDLGLDEAEKANKEDSDPDVEVDDEVDLRAAVWRDLQVAFPSSEEDGDSVMAPQEREFLTAMEIAPSSQLANKSVAQSGLDKLPGVFLVSIERPIEVADAYEVTSDIGSLASFRETPRPVESIDPDEPLKEGDILWFSGSAGAVGDLRKIPGLESYESDEVKKIEEKVHDRRLVQAVVSRKGPLVGKTIADVRFRTRYGAAVIAVHREGQRVHEHPGKVKLHAGDVLLLEAGPSFVEKNAENDRSFALLSEVKDSTPPRLAFLIPALVLTVAMLAVTTAMVTSLLVAALCASILMVCLGILTQQEARDAINWDVFVIIGAAFGIGQALVNSGVASGIADFLVKIGMAVGMSDAGILGAVYLATFLISNVVTNNAAAALIFPIAMDAAEQTGTDPVLMSYCIMLAASASFMSPYGYTTNLLIYGPGGYKYVDFLKIGTPMQIVLWILTTALLSSTALPWYVSWIITSALFVLVAVLRIANCFTMGANCSAVCARWRWRLGY